MDYQRLNHKLVRNPFTLPRINETLPQLEGFQYATALYLNMGYYPISRSLSSQDMTTIVTGLGKFRYKRLPMGMCASGDIFQANIDELLSNIEGAKMYIDDILVLSQDIF